MSDNEKRQRLARVFAEHVLKSDASTPEERAAAEVVFENTTPLTMADVEWNDEKHILGGATMRGGIEVVMMSHYGSTITTNRGAYVNRLLTPNGKKYELHEIGGETETPLAPSTKKMDEYSPEARNDMLGMWAEHNQGGKSSNFVIIEGTLNQMGRVPCYNPAATDSRTRAYEPCTLTPRFDLPRAWDKNSEPCETTVRTCQPKDENETEASKTLRTIEDYKSAPEGTIVDVGGTLIKRGALSWLPTDEYSTFDSEYMSRLGEGEVIRWGKAS